MDFIDLFIGFFIANVLGYGGGPSSIPLMYEEIVTNHQWLSDQQFSNMLALANTLPGPIATKIAAYVGFHVLGWIGVVIAVAATVVPSAVAIIGLVKALDRHRESLIVKGMTLFVQPVIAIMMVVLTWQMGQTSIEAIGIWQSLGIAFVSFWAISRKKIHPALVILAAFAYGGIVLSHYSL